MSRKRRRVRDAVRKTKRIRRSPGVVDHDVEVPLKLDQPGPSRVSTDEVGASEGGATIELIGPSGSQKKLGELGDLGGEPLVGNRVLNYR